MELAELIEGFAEKLGLAGLSLTDGMCQVDIDGMVITFVEVAATHQVITCAEVGEPPPEGRERLYKVLMESMYMGRATGGSTFSLDPENGRLQLFRFDSLLLLDVESFMAMLEKFVNLLEQWRKMIGEFSDAAPGISNAEAEVAAETQRFSLGGFMQV